MSLGEVRASGFEIVNGEVPVIHSAPAPVQVVIVAVVNSVNVECMTHRTRSRKTRIDHRTACGKTAVDHSFPSVCAEEFPFDEGHPLRVKIVLFKSSGGCR